MLASTLAILTGATWLSLTRSSPRFKAITPEENDMQTTTPGGLNLPLSPRD
jgi:hypothetical protein